MFDFSVTSVTDRHMYIVSLSPFHVFKLSECIIIDVVRDNIKEEKRPYR